jgi:hypothetical protein
MTALKNRIYAFLSHQKEEMREEVAGETIYFPIQARRYPPGWIWRLEASSLYE